MQLHLSVILFLSVFQVVSAVVEENIKPYHCCKGQNAFLFVPETDLKCEHSWAKGKTSLARFKDGKGDCVHPCVEVSSGNLTLRECDATTNITLISHCSSENGAQMEEWTQFYPEECPHSDSMVIPPAEAHRVHYGAGIPPILLILLIVMVLIFNWRRRLKMVSHCNNGDLPDSIVFGHVNVDKVV